MVHSTPRAPRSTFDRRRFLKGLGGAAVTAPFLGSLAGRRAVGQSVGAGEAKRLIVMFTHYGCMTDAWFPENSHGPLTAADLEGTSLQALAPHVGKLLMPRGIRAMNQWTSSMTLGQGNDPHTQVVGSYFTCVPVTPNSDDPFSFETATKFQAMPTAPSLDHVCARQVNPGGLPLLMRVSGRSDSPQSGFSYSAGETPYAGVGTPAEALESLTGLTLGSAAPSPDTYEAVRGRSIVDLVRTDLETLERNDLSMADRRLLEAWKELLHETVSAAVNAACDERLLGGLQLTEESLGAVTETTDPLTVEVAPGLSYADVYSNVAVLATLCDQSRITFLKYPGNYIFEGLDLSADTHSISHRIPSPTGTCATGVNDYIQTVDTYYAERFAYLVGQLDSFEEGDGTLLDNTATVWFQEMSDGNEHNLNNLPILQAGSCGGYFKVGQAVNVDDGASDLTRGNSSTICDASDPVVLAASGTPAEFANAPINKYYCNLMNAIGVSGGPDGFPLEGGEGPVTHYGMYDRTEDFVGGGENPANITDPGEFTELRA